MSGKFTTCETLNTLKAIFEKHKSERVCVVGTICTGKTFLLKQLSQYNCVDIDDEFFHLLSEEVFAYLSQTPITKEITDLLYKLAYEKVAVKPGLPMFGFIILDCEAVVYLDISETLLEEHCKKRGDNLTDALFVKKCVEEDWNNHKAKNEKVFYYLTVTE